MSEFEKDMVEYFTIAGRMQGGDESFMRIFSTLSLEPEEIVLSNC